MNLARVLSAIITSKNTMAETETTELTELTEKVERFKRVRIPAIMFKTALIYASEACDCFRYLHYSPTIKACRWITEFSEHLDNAYYSNKAMECQKLDNELADPMEDYFRDFYADLWRTCQNGIRQHHINETFSEQFETGMIYGACAHVLMEWALEWKKKISPQFDYSRGYHPKVQHFLDACKIFSHGDFDTKDNQVVLIKQILTAKWQEVIGLISETNGRLYV